MGVILQRTRLILLLLLISVAMGFLGASNHWLALSSSAVVIGAFLVFKKNLLKVIWFLIPFALFSFLPSDYVPQFEIKTPMGYLAPSVVLICAQLILSVIFGIRHLPIVRLKQNQTVLFTLSLFSVFSAISWWVNGGDLTQLKYVINVFVLSFVSYTLIIIAPFKVRNAAILRIILLMSSIVALLAIMEFFFGVEPYNHAFQNADQLRGATYFYNNTIVHAGQMRRVVSSIGNPLVLSAFLMLCMPVIILVRERSHYKTIWTLVLIVHALATLFTLSRTAIGLMVVMIYFYAFRFAKLQRIVQATILLFAIALIFILALDFLGLEQVFTQRVLFETGTSSYTVRANAYGLAFDALKLSPILGIGPGNTSHYLSQLGVFNTFDNAFLTVLVENGIAGFVFLSVSLAAIGKRISKLEFHYQNAAYLILVVAVVYSFSFHILYFAPIWGTLWLLFGLISVSGTTEMV